MLALFRVYTNQNGQTIGRIDSFLEAGTAQVPVSIKKNKKNHQTDLGHFPPDPVEIYSLYQNDFLFFEKK